MIMKAKQELLEYVKEHNPELYHWYKREEHEEEFGCHYNEEFALCDVEKMYHIAPDGSKHKGEHWSIEQVKSVIMPYKSKMSNEDTCWDAYVALNMWWHDLGCNYKKRNASTADNDIIEDAIRWSFLDDDAPEGKIWRHMQSMK
jgi:hypothetical protein